MSYELSKIEYYVIERKTYERCDYPVNGLSEIISEGYTTHGPFDSKKRALKKIVELEGILISDGWYGLLNGDGSKMTENSQLRKGNHDVYLELTRKVTDCKEIPSKKVNGLIKQRGR